MHPNYPTIDRMIQLQEIEHEQYKPSVVILVEKLGSKSSFTSIIILFGNKFIIVK
jgi:hypothetical protein